MVHPISTVLVAALAVQGAASDADSDRDGLSDFRELHKHFTDPKKADSDRDGVPDGDWNERREFAYSVRAVLHVMAPFDVASMTDDYQDARVLEERADLLEVEVVVYPFNTVASAIEPNAKWRKQPPETKAFTEPGVCCNFDAGMRAQLLEELERDGIRVAELDDVAAVKQVSAWLLERAAFEDGCTTFAVEFEDGAPRLSEHQRRAIEEELGRAGRTLAEQCERELFGKGMFENKVRGSCTSSAIYLSTALRAIGIPTRTVVCVPIVDANDDRELSWLDSRLTHVGVRALVEQAAHDARGSWTSHTFNEVFVGGRWRRLNHANLGQNVLDAETLGLMVHVHTFGDHSEAGLVGWGNRLAHAQHAALFGGPNPYSCTSLSDLFGAHATVANELLTDMRALAIGRIYWYDDPKKDPKLTTELPDLPTAGYLLAHVDTDIHALGGGKAFIQFYEAVERTFVLRARGRPDVPAHGLFKCWIDSDRDLADFVLRIEPADFARMEPGVEYELAWSGEAGVADGALRFEVRDGVAIARAKR